MKAPANLPAFRHLSRVDPVMKTLIKAHGIIPMPQMSNDFEALARIIMGQQLSGKVADKIFARIKSVARGRRLSARLLKACSDQQLQEAGSSRAKIKALRSLVEHFETGKVDPRRLRELSDEEVFATITQVKGMGHWSARIYLMFVLGRQDIFPANDLGIRKAVSELYKVDSTPESLEKISEPWRPYRTIASMYLWHSLNNRQ